MAFCPHCNIPYDEDNETQPCCGGCGHPITCGCDGHSYGRPARPTWIPPSIPRSVPDDSNRSTGSTDSSASDDTGDDTFEPEDDLPF